MNISLYSDETLTVAKYQYSGMPPGPNGAHVFSVIFFYTDVLLEKRADISFFFFNENKTATCLVAGESSLFLASGLAQFH